MRCSPDKRAVIKKLRAYVRRYIPRLSACESYRAEKRNRRIIMWLNYHGMERLAIVLLKMKGSL